MALEKPFPSNPHRPAKHVIWFSRRNNLLQINGFCTLYAAKKFVEAVIGDEEYKWRDTNEFITVDSGMIVKSDTLEDIIEHEYSPQETAWALPEPYASEAHFLATGERYSAKPPPKDFEVVPIPQRRSSTPRPSRDGLTTLATICADIKLDPREARAILRKSNTPKPATGWSGDDAWAKSIKQLLTRGKK